MSLATISGGGSFTRQNITDINNNFTSLAQQLAGTTGNIIYCFPASGFLGTQDGTAGAPYTTLSAAYGAGRSGFNDVIVLVGNGATSGTARVDAAFTWSKSALHLVGIDSGVNISNRARIAPTSTTTAFANFFTVSGSGCRFANIEWFHGFDTGTTAAICMTVTGSRNMFSDCHIAGMGDTASAQSSTSRNLKIGLTGSGENMFVNCTIGIDTVTRTVANASVEFAGATVRNQFIGCLFPIMTSSATTLGILGTGNECIDRFQLFRDCIFLNAVKSTGTTMTVLGSFTTASPGGYVMLFRSSVVGATDWGDANFFANAFIDGLTGVNSTSGLAVPPS